MIYGLQDYLGLSIAGLRIAAVALLVFPGTDAAHPQSVTYPRDYKYLTIALAPDRTSTDGGRKYDGNPTKFVLHEL